MDYHHLQSIRQSQRERAGDFRKKLRQDFVLSQTELAVAAAICDAAKQLPRDFNS
jgi:hypothetical protein